MRNNSVYEYVLLYIVKLLLIEKSMCAHNLSNTLSKCCDFGEIIVEENSTHSCVKNEDKRIVINTRYYNHVKTGQKNITGYCLDIMRDGDNYAVYRFILMNGVITLEESDFGLEYNHKCCPMGYVYHSLTHSCTISKMTRNAASYFMSTTIIKIGLPHCAIIQDIIPDDINGFQVKDSLHNVDYCVDFNEEYEVIVRVCRDDFSVCKGITCLNKCCPDGQSFVKKLHCQDTYDKGLNVSKFASNIKMKTQGEFAVVHGGKCDQMYEVLMSGQNFSISEDGVFSMKEVVSHTNESEYRYYDISEKSYCIEHIQSQAMNRHGIFRCFADSDVYLHKKFLSTRYAMIVSCVFLIITMICYIVTSEVKTLFGKILVTYCVALFIFYALLVNATYYYISRTRKCIMLGYLTMFFHFSVFTWLTTMCFDIYFTFGSARVYSSLHGTNKELKRYALYSLYGWGMPLLLTLIIMLFHYIIILPAAVRIQFGITKCFIEGGPRKYGHLLFSSTPIALMVVCNIYMFVRTINYCLSVSKEINKINDNKSLKRDGWNRVEIYRNRLFLMIKLSCIMGISFIFEVISSFLNFKENKVTENIEIVFDTFNSLQGLFIFIIFICKRRIIMVLLRKSNRTRMTKSSLTSTSTHITTTPSRSVMLALKTYRAELHMERENQKADTTL